MKATFLFLVLLSALATAEEPARYVVLSDVTYRVGNDTKVSHPRIVTLEGRRAKIVVRWDHETQGDRQFSIDVKLEPRGGKLGISLELGAEPSVVIGHTAGTMLEGQPWDVSLEDGFHHPIDFHVTAWRIPPGQDFKGVDEQQRPRFAPAGSTP